MDTINHHSFYFPCSIFYSLSYECEMHVHSVGVRASIKYPGDLCIELIAQKRIHISLPNSLI